jgi:hypothetical protein
MTTPTEPTDTARPAAPDEHLLRLPFDQYGRYRMVQEALAAAAAALGRERLTILDVGGYYQEADGTPRLPSQQFLGAHDLTVLDLPACDLPGYVQGDGTAMSFADSSFDMVISCDTLEHIPPELRRRLVGELVRVARYGVLLICPIHEYRVELAEQVLYAYIQSELHAKHDQLREHREYGLPVADLVRGWFGEAGCALRDYPSGDLHAWLPMMLAKHYLLRFGAGETVANYGLDELYNRDYGLDERREPSYRRLFAAAKQPEGGWLDALHAAIEPTVARGASPRPQRWEGLAAQVLALLQLGLDDRREDMRARQMHQHITNFQQIVAELEQIVAGLQREIAGLHQTVGAQQKLIEQQNDHERWLQTQLTDLKQRATWLQSVVDTQQRRLAAFENNPLARVWRKIRG